MVSNQDSFLNLLKLSVPDIELYSAEEAAEFDSTEQEMSASRSDMSFLSVQNDAARWRSMKAASERKIR